MLSGSMTLSMLSLCMALGGLLAFWLFLSSWRWTTKQNQSQYLHLQSLLVSRVDLSRDTLTLQWKPSASTPSVPGSNLSDHTIIRPPIILKGHFCLQLFYWDRSLWNSPLSWKAEEGQGDNQMIDLAFSQSFHKYPISRQRRRWAATGSTMERRATQRQLGFNLRF